VYHFAIVALLGLAAYKTVDFLLELTAIEARGVVKTFLTLGVGVAFTEILDYSVFAGWGVDLRSAWMGPVWTGLMVGGIAYAWPEVFGFVGSLGHRGAAEPEHRAPRAA
jgi:hypothetical protein